MTPLSVLDTSWAVNLCRTDVTSVFLFSNVSRSSLIEVLSSGDGRARSLPRPRQVVGSEDARRWEPRQRREETPPSQKQSFALGSIYDCHFLALFGKPFPSVVLLPPFFSGPSSFSSFSSSSSYPHYSRHLPPVTYMPASTTSHSRRLRRVSAYAPANKEGPTSETLSPPVGESRLFQLDLCISTRCQTNRQGEWTEGATTVHFQTAMPKQ